MINVVPGVYISMSPQAEEITEDVNWNKKTGAFVKVRVLVEQVLKG